MSYNFNNPPSGTGGPVIRWLVGAVQFLSRQLNGIAANGGGGGGTGSRYLRKQVFTPTISTLEYNPPASPSFTVGAIVSGDVTLASGTIVDIDDVNGILYLIDISGTFDGSDTIYTDDQGGMAGSAGTRAELQTDVAIKSDIDVLYYDPRVDSPKATITLPPSPTDGQLVYIYYGGIQHKQGDPVITLPRIVPAGHELLVADNFLTKAQVGTPTSALYRGDTDSWYLSE